MTSPVAMGDLRRCFLVWGYRLSGLIWIQRWFVCWLGDNQEQGACANAFQLPFADNSFDGVICIRLLHLQYSDAERLAILRELARVSCCYVIISVYQFTPLHGVARLLNSTPGRVKLMTREQLSDLVRESGLERQSICCLMPYFHMQTFVVLTKRAVR